MTVLERNLEEAAKAAEDLREFRAYLQGTLASGELTPEDLKLRLQRVYEHIESVNDPALEPASDLVLDGLDLVTGWCGPSFRLVQRQSA